MIMSIAIAQETGSHHICLSITYEDGTQNRASVSTTTASALSGAEHMYWNMAFETFCLHSYIQ